MRERSTQEWRPACSRTLSSGWFIRSTACSLSLQQKARVSRQEARAWEPGSGERQRKRQRVSWEVGRGGWKQCLCWRLQNVSTSKRTLIAFQVEVQALPTPLSCPEAFSDPWVGRGRAGGADGSCLVLGVIFFLASVPGSALAPQESPSPPAIAPSIKRRGSMGRAASTPMQLLSRIQG